MAQNCPNFKKSIIFGNGKVNQIWIRWSNWIWAIFGNFIAIFPEIAHTPHFTTNTTIIWNLVNSENRHKIAKNHPNSIWSTNSNPVDFAISKNNRLFEIRAILGHKTPKCGYRAGRLQPLWIFRTHESNESMVSRKNSIIMPKQIH